MKNIKTAIFNQWRAMLNYGRIPLFEIELNNGACIALLLESWETIDYMQQHDVASFSAYKNVTGA